MKRVHQHLKPQVSAEPDEDQNKHSEQGTRGRVKPQSDISKTTCQDATRSLGFVLPPPFPPLFPHSLTSSTPHLNYL